MKLGMLLLLIPTLALATEDKGLVHIVREGQSISTITQHYWNGRLYGKKGAVARVIAFNKSLSGSSAIRTGQELFIPPDIYAGNTCPAPAPAASITEKDLRLPASQEKPVIASTLEDDDSDQANTLGLKLGYEYFRIDAQDRSTNSSASFLSRMSPTAQLSWNLEWSKQWSSTFLFKIRRESLATADTAGKSIDGSEGTSVNAYLRMNRHWESGAVSAVEFGRSESPFLYSPTSNSVRIDRTGVAAAAILHEQPIIRVKKVVAGLAGKASVLLPGAGAGYKTDAGWAGEIGAFVEREREFFTIRGEAFASRRFQNTTLTKQTIDASGLAVLFKWRIP